MAQLGETSNPRDLVPGSPDALDTTAQYMRAYGDVLVEAGEGLKRIDTEAGWRGKAGDAFRERFEGEPKRWIQAGDNFHDAAKALQSYISTLRHAQQLAKAAIDQFERGEKASESARNQHDQKVREAANRGDNSPIPFHDPGEADREAARGSLESARDSVDGAGKTSAALVKKATESAPERPGFWSKVGDFFSDAGEGLWEGGKTAVNDLASFGNAMLQHPGDDALMLGGMLLAGVSSGGEALGVALDATGAGAVLGVPLNVVSAAGIAAGAGMVGAGAMDLAQHGTSDSAVEPLQMNSEGSGTGGSVQKPASDLIKDGQEYKGTGSGRHKNDLPENNGPKNGTLYKRDPDTGNVTSYATYDANGNPIKRVDLEGKPHGGVETPHVVEYESNTNPKTGEVFVRPSRKAREAFPYEVP